MARIFNLPETKGVYQLKGIVTGTEKDNFYKEGKTKKGSSMRTVNFGVEVEDGKTIYLELMGMPKKEVYFSKRGEKKGDKSITKKVNWEERSTFNETGFRMIGVNTGVKKVINTEGKYVNDKKTLVEFDACKEIGDNLKDGYSIFSRGKIDYSSFKSNEGNTIRRVKFVPNQISLCRDIDFNDEKFEADHDFTQNIVFMGIEKKEDRFVISAKIITYSSIEEAEFIVEDAKLAKMFAKSLKPYTAITVWGKLDTKSDTTEVESTNVWGSSNNMTRVNAPIRRELVITGAEPSSIDTTVYTQSAIEEAMLKIKNSQNAAQDFGTSNDNNDAAWGTSANVSSLDDEDAPW